MTDAKGGRRRIRPKAGVESGWGAGNSVAGASGPCFAVVVLVEGARTDVAIGGVAAVAVIVAGLANAVLEEDVAAAVVVIRLVGVAYVACWHHRRFWQSL